MKGEHVLTSPAQPSQASPSRPIRILRIIARLNIGGPARHVALLSAGLDRKGYRHLLVAGKESDDEGNLRNLTNELGVEVTDLPRLGREISLWKDAFCVWELIRIIWKFRPDIVHTHTAKAGFIGRIAAFVAGVPCIAHTFHGHVLRGYFSVLKNLVFRNLEQILAKKTDLLVTVSRKVAEELAQEGVAPVHRFEVVPLGLLLGSFLKVEPHADLKKELGLPEGARLMGAVGRLVPIKDLGTLLDAMAVLRKDESGLHLAFVGDGESRHALMESARHKGLGDQVHTLGWRHDLGFIYGGLDLVVLSSRNEGTPVSLIEALAAGRPVVATAVGGVPEVLEEGRLGRLVPAGDAVGLAEAIRIELGRSAPLSQSQREGIVDRYSPEKLVDRMDKLYRRILARRGDLALQFLR